MLDRSPLSRFVTYAVLLAGVAIVALPVWVTFVASTQTLEQVLAAPMSLVPGSRLFHNYAEVLAAGAGNSGAPVVRMMTNSLVMALAIAPGKIAISLLSAFALIYFRFRFRRLAFWLIFVTLMLPVEVRNAHLPGDVRPAPARHLRRTHAAGSRRRPRPSCSASSS